MKSFLPFLAIGLLVAVGALFAELPAQAEIILKSVAALLGLILTFLLFKGTSDVPVEASSPQPKEEPSKPAPSEAKGSAEAEVITFLARMQDKGRLIDFLMDDISGADDAAIGAAARVVYQGCKSVLDEHFDIAAIESGNEGGSVTVPEGYDANLYRLTGNLSGSAPFNGTLVHKGWKVTSANLPKVIASESGDFPPLAPAQVEI